MSASRKQLNKNINVKKIRQTQCQKFDLNKIYVGFDWFVNFLTLFMHKKKKKEIGAGHVKQTFTILYYNFLKCYTLGKCVVLH